MTSFTKDSRDICPFVDDDPPFAKQVLRTTTSQCFITLIVGAAQREKQPSDRQTDSQPDRQPLVV